MFLVAALFNNWISENVAVSSGELVGRKQFLPALGPTERGHEDEASEVSHPQPQPDTEESLAQGESPTVITMRTRRRVLRGGSDLFQQGGTDSGGLGTPHPSSARTTQGSFVI